MTVALFRWQLLTPALTLHQFINFPHFTAEFFQNGLELETEVGTPWTIQDKATLVISSWEVMRYKVDSLYCLLCLDSGVSAHVVRGRAG